MPVGSEYLGCMRDMKHSPSARALFDGMLVCPGTMTTQVRDHYFHGVGGDSSVAVIVWLKVLQDLPVVDDARN